MAGTSWYCILYYTGHVIHIFNCKCTVNIDVFDICYNK